MAPIGLFAAGVICIMAAVLSGDADVSLFLVFPVFSGSSSLFMLGTVLIVFSFILGFMFLMMGQMELARADLDTFRTGAEPDGPAGRGRYGGVVLIGPVPIAFGSDKGMALAMLVAGIVVAIVALTVIVLLLG